MRFCCREITIDETDLRVYPSGNIWRSNISSKKWSRIKGAVSSWGYLHVRINKKNYSIHRIVAHAYFGFDLSSPLMIDHRDRNRWNNAVWNLRIVNRNENQWNNGAKGIKKVNEKWVATIKVNGGLNYKRFNTEEEALAWRKEMKTLYRKITEPDYKHIMTQCLRNI